MTLWIKNEDDIIDQNIQYHLNTGVDYIIATDNNSTDNTRDILLKYEKENVLKYYHSDSIAHEQSKYVKIMAREAYSKYKADWVINNDADEFWVTGFNNLKDCFKEFKDNKFLVPYRSDFVFMRGDDIFYKKMLYKRYTGQFKCAHRGTKNITVSFGNHWARCPQWGISPRKGNVPRDCLEILHFPLRNSKQIKNKIVNGTKAILNNKGAGTYCCAHWRPHYNTFEKNNSIEEVIRNIEIKTGRLKSLLARNVLKEDLRLVNFFKKHE